MASDDVERIGQALLNAPLTSANNVRGLLAKLEDINAHDQVRYIGQNLQDVRAHV
jgi:hypothetical protein